MDAEAGLERDAIEGPLRLPLAELRDLQEANLRRQIAWVAAGHPYYRRVFEERAIDPVSIRSIADLSRLPFTTKADYMRSPDAFRLAPQPSMSVHEKLLWDLSYTTGTTAGAPTPFYNTTYDYYAILLALHRLCRISDIRATDVIANLFPLAPVPHIGFLRTRDYASVVGATVFSTLTGTPHPEFPIHNSLDHAVRRVEQHRATVLSGIVSYVRRVIMRAQELGADFSSVRLAIVLGEPCPRGMREDMRARLRALGAKDGARIINALGFTEMQAATGECKELGGGHNPAPEQLLFEVVDEATREPLPDGERGLLTVTHLDRRGTVLLRYLLGDICAIETGVCPHCGRTGQRVVTNVVRTKELVKVKGTLVNPDLMKEAIATVSGIDEYQIVFTKEDAADRYSGDRVVVRLAVAAADDGARDRIAAAVRDRVAAAAELRPAIEFTTMDAIFDPTKTLKSSRVVDLRPVDEE